jgi:hypothetical protein
MGAVDGCGGAGTRLHLFGATHISNPATQVPTAVLLVGINVPDHISMFSQLTAHLETVRRRVFRSQH